MYTLECNKLCKRYDKVRNVIDNLDLQIPEGKIVGLLGPNGCGKSTLIKMAAGLLQPTSGEILVCGQPVAEATNSLISDLPERTSFDSSMQVSQLIGFFEEFYPDFDRARTLHMLRDLGIDVNMRLKTLSKGTKEKVQLVMVMSRNARLYMLDEPIGGVDPAARDYILNTIVANYNPNATVLITTHLINDVEKLLDEFFFIGYGGAILRSGSADEVRESEGKSLDELFREEFRCSVNY